MIHGDLESSKLVYSNVYKGLFHHKYQYFHTYQKVYYYLALLRPRLEWLMRQAEHCLMKHPTCKAQIQQFLVSDRNQTWSESLSVITHTYGFK